MNYKASSFLVLAMAAASMVHMHATRANEVKKDEVKRGGALRTYYLPCPSEGREDWKPGAHYNVLIQPSEDTAKSKPGDKVELLQLSMYTSSDQYKSALKQYLKSNKDVVRYVRQPSIAYGMPHAKLQARMFYTLSQLGRDDLHDQLDSWIRENKKERYVVYHAIWNPNEVEFFNVSLSFAKEHGIDEKKFGEVWHSDDVDEKVRKAEGNTAVNYVTGTPTFVINERYSVNLQRLVSNFWTEDFELLIKLIDYLVKSEALGGCRQPVPAVR